MKRYDMVVLIKLKAAASDFKHLYVYFSRMFLVIVRVV